MNGKFPLLNFQLVLSAPAFFNTSNKLRITTSVNQTAQNSIIPCLTVTKSKFKKHNSSPERKSTY